MVLKEMKTNNDRISENEDDEEDDPIDRTPFFTYRTLADLRYEYKKGQPLSCVLTDSEEHPGKPEIYCCFYHGRDIRVARFINVGDPPTDQFALWYHRIQLQHLENDVLDDIDQYTKQLGDIKVKSHGLMLPLVSHGKESGEVGELDPQKMRLYAIVDSGWKVLGKEGSLIFPHYYVQQTYFQEVLVYEDKPDDDPGWCYD